MLCFLLVSCPTVNCVLVPYAVEHERLVEAYSVVNQKLQHSLSEQINLERNLQEFKVCDNLIMVKEFVLSFLHGHSCFFVDQADLRRHERDYSVAQKEIVDLQKQVTGRTSHKLSIK